MTIKTSNVLIVGAGPIGLLLGISLRQYGIHVTVIDKISQHYNKFSKALTINATSLNIFHGLGIAQAFLDCGKKLSKADIYFNQKRIASINNNYLKSLYNFYLGIPQPDIERILEEILGQYSTFVQYQKELVTIAPQNDCVQVTIQDSGSGSRKNETFEYVIGCDGARSAVRKLLHIPFTGKNYDRQLILGDMRFDNPSSAPHLAYYIDDKGFMITYPISNDYTRVVIQQNETSLDPAEKLTQKDFQPYIDAYSPVKSSIVELGWSSSVELLNRMAQSMRINRIFLAGDAAHLFSPIGGQAMNTGFQDAFDLAWKLAYVLKREAKKILLDTYESDRMMAAKKVLAVTDHYTNLITGQTRDKSTWNNLQPLFKNRLFFKKTLPYLFSGYYADYRTQENDLVGRHIPYLKLYGQEKNIKSTYDLPKLQKYVLFCLRTSSPAHSFTQNYHSTLKFIETDDATLVKALALSQKTLCLISPSGYIVAHGDHQKIEEYLEKYIVKKMPLTATHLE